MSCAVPAARQSASGGDGFLFSVRAEVQDEGVAFDDDRLGGAGRDGLATVVVFGHGQGALHLVLPVGQGGQ